ncbi:hypothetical protein BDZ94DRAFT_1211775 [Collybia nuda]|uniref:Arf-GAP domain-containing protein n=1 Tax=Collybia nuda TaxID=64659 RepID=A0A9P5YDI2_9AGAR|nr:hypothetical protein BDZ94DRAFT_1211775 [Collybia nuda]
MSRQDKATTERFTRTLRELVKRPENKVCADCKRNDPRWASWNIGVFLCIRCSGIHRGMGTHISKVKSVDLDVWTPEQMESIQKWGNHLANLYWEAHLKPGHVPPEHKMESFVRSKYESRRWALDGPPPTDPSVLDKGSVAPAQPIEQQAPQAPSVSRPAHAPSGSISTRSPVTRQPQAHQLLSSNYTNTQHRPSVATRGTAPVAQAPTPPPTQPPAPENELFSLDFHAPPVTSSSTNDSATHPKKDVKQDILSLFSSPPAPVAPAFGQFGGAAQISPWGAVQSQQPQQQQQHMQMQMQQPTSMIGNNGAGAWGASSGWTGAPAAVPPAQGSLWGNPTNSMPGFQQQQVNIFNTNDVWGSTAPTGAPAQDLFSTPFSTTTTQKKDDAFGDIWGGFK